MKKCNTTPKFICICICIMYICSAFSLFSSITAGIQLLIAKKKQCNYLSETPSTTSISLKIRRNFYLQQRSLRFQHHFSRSLGHTGVRPDLADYHISPAHCDVILSTHQIIYEQCTGEKWYLPRTGRTPVCFDICETQLL